MSKTISIFIFRRDLRLSDNIGLNAAQSQSDGVIPLFIVTPAQVSKLNPYASSNAIQFMMESVAELSQRISKQNPKCRLWVGYGSEIYVLRKIIRHFTISAIYVNIDYTPYAIKRDMQIKQLCLENNIKFRAESDVLLTPCIRVRTKAGNHYTNFTHFYNSTKNMSIPKPLHPRKMKWVVQPSKFKIWNYRVVDKFIKSKDFYQFNPNLAVNGGRNGGVKILKSMNKFKSYDKTRNDLSRSTTKLSAHNKFGTVSIREVYWAIKSKSKSKALLKQLYWRDFYYYVSVNIPKLFTHKYIGTRRSNLKIKWRTSPKMFQLWCDGQTGFPIVDAGMRELNATGFMHNRSRLITSSFLVKDLLINWKYGERYFSQKLVDIDRCQNTGNWNWSSSFGLDNSLFLRIMNPWSQSVTYDPDCVYIKKWIPELENIPINEIHNWDKYWDAHPGVYSKPIVIHSEARKDFLYEYY